MRRRPRKPFCLQRHILAAPSWVMPGTLAENCRFLAGKVDEVGLLFFESKACLAYTRQDLPSDLAALPLTWHVHLPLDLPWACGRKAAETALRLMEKVVFLGAERAVLHPPPQGNSRDADRAMDGFVREWECGGRAPGSLLLENTRDNDPMRLTPLITNHGLGFCLDFGHMLAYGQIGNALQLLRNVGYPAMVHWSAAGPFGGGSKGHGCLAGLPDEARDLGRNLFALAPEGTIMMLELFAWRLIESSFPVLRAWEATRP